jgi:hypothetical protein
MYKTALAAFSLALSLGLLTIPVSADNQSGQQSQGQGSGQGSGNNNQDSSSSSSSSSSGSGSGSGSGNSSGTNSADKKDSTSSTTTSSAASTKATPAAPPPVYVQTYGKYANTTKPAATTTTVTSTGAQKSTSTSTVTKTASIGKTGAKAGAAAPAATATVAKKSKDEVVVLQESGDKKYTSTKNKQWQTFVDYITVKPGQESLPLTLTVTNAGYTGVNMVLGGSKLASDKDFKGTTLRMQMTGALVTGDNKLETQLYGPIGAKLSWKLTTLKPTITSIKPGSAATKDDITLTGRNFAKSAAGNVVYVGNKVAVVKANTSTSGKEIIFNLPADILAGKQNVIVSVGGIQSKPIELIIKAAPEVTGVDLLSAPPGQEMNISGKGFSTTQSENIVTIGGTPAQIVSSSAKSITVTVPEMFYPQWDLPVVVKTGGIESNSTIKMNIQSRVIPNQGVPEQ